AAGQEQARWGLEPLSPSPAQSARWEKGEEIRWGQLPTLRGYVPSLDNQARPASDRQLGLLRRTFGFDINRRLTRGEASHLIDECRRLDRLYPTPATAAQKRMLRAR